MIAKFRAILTKRVLVKAITLIIAFTLLPIIILLYGLSSEPEWIQKKKHHLKNNLVLTIEVPFSKNLLQTKTLLYEKAEEYFKYELEQQAYKQLRVSYHWESLDLNVQDYLREVLREEIFSLSALPMEEQSLYETDKNLYGLFSMKKNHMEVTLQGIYEEVNVAMQKRF